MARFGRLLRMLAALFFVGAVLLIGLPYTTSYVSTSAVVNAPLVAIKAPFDGTLRSAGRQAGEIIPAQTPVLSLTIDRQSLIERERVRSQLFAQVGQLSALETQARDLEAQATVLEARREQALSDAIALRTQQIHNLTEQKLNDRAELALLERISERTAGLVVSGATSQLEADTRHAEAIAARARLTRTQGDLEEGERDLALLREGRFPGDLAEEGAYIDARQDELRIRLVDLSAERGQLESTLSGTRHQLETLSFEIGRNRVFEPTLPVPTVVWSASPSEGSVVSEGDTLTRLLDCSRRFVEAPLAERHFNRIDIGSRAVVRLVGSDRRIEGTVTALRGGQATPERELVAAELPETARGEMRASIALPAISPDADVQTAAFCDVGRTAEARFPRAQGGTLFDALEMRLASLIRWLELSS